MKFAPLLIAATTLAWTSSGWAQAQPIGGKPATAATKAANAAVLNELPFNDKADFEDAQRGLVAKPDTLTIRNAKGDVVWDLEAYKQYIGLDKAAPDTVNPSLWRNAQLGMQNGLFKVSDRIYQVRGFDLSNITFVQGDTGWIVLDPLRMSISSSRPITGRCGATPRSSTTGRSSATCTSTRMTSRST